MSGQLVVAGYSYPVGWALYRRQAECEAAGVDFVSKPALAAAIISEYEPLPDTQTTVLTDSWYASNDLLDLCAGRGFKYIGAVKSNRKFKTSRHNLQIKQWLNILPKSNLDRVKINDNRYKLWASVGQLSSGRAVKMVINRRIGVKKWHYLISTDLNLSPQTIMGRYFIRWEVENFYRAAKQLLGWGDYQMRDLVAIENHVVLMMITHAYLDSNAVMPLT